MPETRDSRLTGLPGLVGFHGCGQMSQLLRTAPALMSLHGEWPRAKLRSGRETGTGPAVPGTRHICCPGLGDALLHEAPVETKHTQSYPSVKIN